MALAEKDSLVLERAGSAFAKKGNLDSFWQEVALNHYPERADFTVQHPLGTDMTSTLYSAEPILFRREFGNFLGSILRPKGRQWFSMAPSHPQLKASTRVQTYLAPKVELMRGMLYSRRANYSRAMSTGDHDYATFGNAVGSVTETPDKQALNFRTWHLRDCAWLQNNDAIVDTLFRKFRPTVRELRAKEKSGWKLCPKIDAIKDKELDRPIECMHIEMPLIDYDYTLKQVQFEWVSLYYDVENRHLMSFKPVPEFDYFVDRWFLMDGCQYGVSPCVVCSLPDARSLQTMTWSIIEAGEKAVEPPLIGTHEAVLGGVDVRSGSVTWIDKNYDERTGEALRALDLGGNPQFGEVLRQAVTQNLNAAWFLNKLFMPQSYDKTAYEANRLHEEFLRAASPIIEPAEAERNGNHLDIVFAKTMRMGLWGNIKEEMPKELQGRQIDFTYDNPMEDARKQEATFAYKSAMEITLAAKQYDPKATAAFKHTKAYRDAIAGVGKPDWLLDEDEAEKAIAQADEDQTMDEAAAQFGAAAESASKMEPKRQQLRIAA